MVLTNTHKKILIVSAILIVAGAASAVVFYKNAHQAPVAPVTPAPESEQTPNTNATQPPSPQSPNITNGGITVTPQNPSSQGIFTICSDKCGDGICQKADPTCKSDDPNCVCPETVKECPQDCKL